MTITIRFAGVALAGTFALALTAGSVLAYDGTNCRAPGNCWEAKPGFPDKIEGTKYDPKHDPKELEKQSESIKGMEARNAKRSEHFKKTGKRVYDVSKL